MLGRDRQMEALQLHNDQLKEAVDSLEHELAQRMSDQASRMHLILLCNTHLV